MEQLIFPPYLKPGDKAIVISPSGHMDHDILLGIRKRLQQWGLRVSMARHSGSEYATFAGTVRQRLADLQRAMDDPDARLIFCSRGGYGAQHLMGHLDFTRFRQSPKWLIGFSDITALHCYFQQQGFASLHGPMARHIVEEPEDDFATQSIHRILFGEMEGRNRIISYTCDAHPLNHRGTAQGILRGGNLATFYGLRGTPYDIPAPGTILFIEDVGEKPHAVERMVYNLKISGMLQQLKGLIIGQFTEYTEACQLGKELYPALADVVREYHIPVCFNFPVGHVKENYPLIEGCLVKLQIGRQTKLTLLR